MHLARGKAGTNAKGGSEKVGANGKWVEKRTEEGEPAKSSTEGERKNFSPKGRVGKDMGNTPGGG